MARNKRQKKKAEKKDIYESKCPECGSSDGLIGHFKKGKKFKSVYLFCVDCGYDYTKDKKKKRDVDKS